MTSLCFMVVMSFLKAVLSCEYCTLLPCQCLFSLWSPPFSHPLLWLCLLCGFAGVIVYMAGFTVNSLCSVPHLPFCQFSSGSLINVCTSALTSSRYFPGSLLICVLAQCVNRIWGEAHLEQIHRTVIVCCCQLNPRGPSRHEPHPLPYSITKHSRPICFSRW